MDSPANPTGGAVSKDELDRLVAGLEAHPHVAIMSDEIYGSLSFHEDYRDRKVSLMVVVAVFFCFFRFFDI